ncbi:ABC transporter permease [Aureibacillus halotolerans]|uniref:ABC-type nitrate/sulfonate/bicarbonate transport system permease component n=1 Tax=Aureibacillus halotolerans TaxID=1508390 RepID=A0A4R6TTU8_9BACI|nr:ABC transporter permease [Aureibacillus halotolerans]TDQ36741.1 ABC-type nitrate/sulfonate/bicarbonate transport system permease component [Aureibacillus halotolerans]
MRKSGNIEINRAFTRGVLLPTCFILMLLLCWEVGVWLTGIEHWILPPPSVVIQTFFLSWPLLLTHIGPTVTETLIGLGIAIVVAVLIATLTDLAFWLRQTLYPPLVISQTIPIIAVAPLFMIWFGYGLTPKIIVVALVCFFPMTISLADGYRQVDPAMIKLLRSMGATRWHIFKMVKLPAALPAFFSGLRIAGTYSVMGAVIGEWLGASKGLGVFMTRSSQSFQTDRVFAAILVIVLLSLLIYGLIEWISRLVMPWQSQRVQQKTSHRDKKTISKNKE